VPLAALGRQDDADLPAALALAVTAEAGLVHLDGPADLLQPGFTLSGYTLTNGTKKTWPSGCANLKPNQLGDQFTHFF
jgi:hypothetical protein